VLRLSCAFFLILSNTVASPAADNRAIADAAFEELMARDFAALAKRFSPEMSAAMASEKLPAAVGPVLNSLGILRSGRPEPQVTGSQGYDVFLYTAEFENAKMTVVISINSAGQVGGLFLRPPQPEPAKPGELAVTSGNFKLPATLVVPEGDGPFPAVVLVHGSGPGDRDETVGANAPFKDLAEGLGKHGIASLRYVKRTRQYPLSGVATVKDEVIDDALNAVALLRSQPDIDPQRVYVLGHSMGAYLAPRIAEADDTLAGIVMLAGNVRPILELARDQLQYLNAPPDRLQQLKATAPASYWEDLESYDPVATARKLEMPILILQGERDYQVTMKEFDLWKSGMQGYGNVTFESYPKLNHLFLEGEGKSLPAEYGKPGHIPDYVFADIAAFVSGVSLPVADSRAVADAAFDELLGRDFAALAKRFSPEMSAAMPSEKLSAAVGPVLDSLGALRSGRPVPQVAGSQGVEVFLYPAEFDKAKMTVVISVNSRGQIAGLFLRPPSQEP
jgi:dienelactone hydrolase